MSTNPNWHYAKNTFAINTQGSNVRMLSLSTDTHAKLKAEESNPAIAAILVIYEPVFFAYRDLDQQYGVKSGDYAGTTLGFEEYLNHIPNKLRQWESLIRFVYVEDSPEEKAIFPNKRAPFESGTYESRLDALGSLKLKTAADLSLAAAAAQITSFYNAALGARLVQQTNEGGLAQLRDLRENQRLLLADELHGVLGQLMFIHRHNPTEVQRYFNLSLLQDHSNDPITASGNINAGQVISISALFPDLEPAPESIIRMKNTSENPLTLTFYSAANGTDEPGSGPQFTVNSGDTLVKTVADFEFENYNSFNVFNSSAITGSWEITIEV